MPLCGESRPLAPQCPEAVRAWAGSPPAWLTVQDPEQTDPTIRPGAGEVTAISLAQELAAWRTLIDERKGDRAARDRGLIAFDKTLDWLVQTTNFHLSVEVLEHYKRKVRAKRGDEGA